MNLGVEVASATPITTWLTRVPPRAAAAYSSSRVVPLPGVFFLGETDVDVEKRGSVSPSLARNGLHQCVVLHLVLIQYCFTFISCITNILTVDSTSAR